jgi:hypothetical protein
MNVVNISAIKVAPDVYTYTLSLFKCQETNMEYQFMTPPEVFYKLCLYAARSGGVQGKWHVYRALYGAVKL